MAQKPLDIPGKAPAADVPMDEDDDDLSVLLSRSAPKIERHKTVVPIHKDDVEYSDFDRAIVVAIDESSNSDAVVTWAADRLLRRRKDLVVLVNVQPESKTWKHTSSASSSTLPSASASASTSASALPGSSTKPPSDAAVAGSSIRAANIGRPVGRIAAEATTEASVSQIDDEAKERCRKILSPYAERLQRDGFVVKGICLIGNPKEVLVASTNIKKPTMIVMGTHGRGSVKRFLMGSVAEYVLHHSSIPVVIVPNGSGRASASTSTPAGEGE
ncbi:hypothetical protein LPJ53_005850 [Coemansia erecta]|uniref:UspA domain-containing protein n=1 Tax=Coemansia erecta TaxID=147472 RepID=A0A9W7XWL3_9FUNG|nr:hypothetical protein LPJ53_005850 [Coemansia erecta]